MKINAILLILTLGLLMTSCKKDEDDNLDGVPLAGMINGKEFTYGNAIFTESASEFDIEIYNLSEEIIDSCSTNFGEVRAFFDSEKTTDKQKLDFDLFSFSGYTITLFDPDGNSNIIVTEGYFKINEITDNVLSAEMDIKDGSDNFLRGQFEIYRCN